MTQEEKITFVRELIDNVRDEIIAKVPNMPDEWDGHELRRFIADRFEEANMGLLARGQVRSRGNSKRLKAYRNEVIVNNLL